MKSIAIVTDSNCGMSPAQVKDLGIYMLPMPFFIDDKEYLEDIDMNQSEFFQHLEQKSRLQSFHIPAHTGIRHYPLGQAAQRLRRDRTYPHVQRSLQFHADCPHACRRL